MEPSQSGLAILEEEEDEGYNSEELRSDVEFEEDNVGKKHKRVKWPQFNEGVHVQIHRSHTSG